ncbi:MAG: flagellar type III secretion system pore protein FliP [Oscillospiraceae bacterium]|nr:flagellar type III secretion system pore protein FliP [Oscillospiraceae bacterium]
MTAALQMEKVTEEKKASKKEQTKSGTKRIIKVLALVVILLLMIPTITASAAGEINVNIDNDGLETVEIVIMLTIITLLPSILLLTTCFTRIVIVLSFLRSAMSLQTTPPNQVIIGIALCLSLFVMSPVISTIEEEAYQPYKEGTITQQEFISKAQGPIKRFMLKNTKTDDLNLFVDISNTKDVQNPEDLDLTVIISAFITSELRRAFIIGFLLYIPFLVIDMIVSSTLMSMGMVMLPPTTIAMPFKLMLFVLVDGWELIFKMLVSSFNV